MSAQPVEDVQGAGQPSPVETIVGHYRRRGAIARGDFQLTGGGTSDLYVDGRLVCTDPLGLDAVARATADLLTSRGLVATGTTLVAPVLSGVPLTVAVALRLERPYVMDRGVEKAHGTGRRFEGTFLGTRSIVLDDLATVGGTVVGCVEALRHLGQQVEDVVVIVNREEGAAERLASLGVTLHWLVTKSDLMKGLAGEDHGE